MRRDLTIACCAAGLLVSACAGKPSVKEQYDKRVKDINDKYDKLYVPPEAPLAGARATGCDEFVDKLKAKYTLWKPGDSTQRFCGTRPKARQLKDFELKVREAHDQAVEKIRARRLAHLKELYAQAEKVDGGGGEIPDEKTEAQTKAKTKAKIAKQADRDRLRDKESDAQAASAEAAEPAEASQFEFRPTSVDDADLTPANAAAPTKAASTKAAARASARAKMAPSAAAPAAAGSDPDQLPFAPDVDPAPAADAAPTEAPPPMAELPRPKAAQRPASKPAAGEYDEAPAGSSGVPGMEYE